MAGLIVHEWIEKHGGSENVFRAMAKTFPDAAIHCLWNDAAERFEDRRVTESWMAKTPLRRNKVAALPFMPATWSNFDVTNEEFVLVSSHLFAHHVGGRERENGSRKYVYVHTPARYIWARQSDSRGNSPLARAAAPALRALDRRRAAQGAEFAANSNYVRDRIRQSWDRNARVIYPPVDVLRIQSEEDWSDKLTAVETNILRGLPRPFLLGASRFVAYKRLDVVIQAGEAAGLPVVLAGSGPQLDELKVIAEGATVPVFLVDRPSDELLYALYQAAVAFVFPATEDFGIMPVEAMSLGTPVIVSGEGGAPESVRALQGGVILDSFSREALREAVSSASLLEMSEAARTAREVFGEQRFARELRQWMGVGQT